MSKLKAKNLIAYIAALLVIVMSGFFFVGCNKPSLKRGSFVAPVIERTIGDVIDLDKLYEGDSAIFVSSNENVLAEQDENFVVVGYGRASLMAMDNKNIIALMDVVSWPQFPKPTNLKVSPDGAITWDNITFTFDGEQIIPRYKIRFADGGEYYSETNSFNISNNGIASGAYEVYISAVAKNEQKFISSQESKISFKFDVKEGATDFVFMPNSEFGSQDGVLSWSGDGKASLSIDGANTTLESSDINLDFSAYDEGDEVNVKLALFDDENGYSKNQEKVITKLETPSLSITDNKLVWNSNEGASEYVFAVKSQIGNKNRQFRESANSTVFSGLGEGIYSFTYQALGKEGYANGNVKSFSQIGKVRNFDLRSEMSGDKLVLNLTTTSQFNRKALVKLNGETYNTYDFAEGQNSLRIEVQLASGINEVVVQAMPTLTGGLFTYGNQSAGSVLCGDEQLVTAYNFANISNIKHSLSDGESIFSFNYDEVLANEATFKVKINGKDVVGARQSVDGALVSVNVGTITSAQYPFTQGSGNKFNASITAIKTGGFYKAGTGDTTLTLLSAPTRSLLSRNELSDERYTWNKVVDLTNDSDVAKYECKLYKSQDGFNFADVEPEILVMEEAQTGVLGAGYYKIEVRALPLNEECENKYLPSEQILVDEFYHADQIESAPIKLEEEGEKYKLSIKTVENGYRYEVFINGGDEPVKVFDLDGNEILEYLFEKDVLFAQAGQENKIEVKVSAKDDIAKAIHKQSAPSVLTIEKFVEPSDYEVLDDSTLSITCTDSSAMIEVFEDGKQSQIFGDGQNATVDLDAYDGNFKIGARFLGYVDYEDFTTNGNVKLTSDIHYFNFRRVDAPSGLSYFDGIVKFNHADDKASQVEYIVEIAVVAQYGAVKAEFRVNGGQTSFNLEEKIAEIRSENEEFDSVYSNQTAISLSMIAYLSQEIDGVYYLPSRQATTLEAEGEHSLLMTKLMPVVLNYDGGANLLWWLGVSDRTTKYEVYFKGTLVENAITINAEKNRYEFNLSKDEYDFTQENCNFYVIAKSVNALASEPSNEALFHKISPLSSLQVFQIGGKYYADILLPSSEMGHISKVLVNKVDISADLSKANVRFEINGNSTLQAVGKVYTNPQGDIEIYVSSDEAIYEFEAIDLTDYNPSLIATESNISWQEYTANEWRAAADGKVLYGLEFLSDSGELLGEVLGIETNSISLLDEKLTFITDGMVAQNYTINVKVYPSDYVITAGGKGYYGSQKKQNNSTLAKLQSVTEVTTTISESASSDITTELAKKVKLSWKFNGNTSNATRDELKFALYINDEFYDFVNGENSTSDYSIEIEQTLFTKTINNITIYAQSNTSFRSSGQNSTPIKVYAAPSVTLSDDGSLEIEKDDSNGVKHYLLEITVNRDEVKTFAISTNVNINTKEFLGTFTKGIKSNPQVQVKLIQVASVFDGGVILPAKSECLTSKLMLETPSITQDEAGLRVAPNSYVEGTVIYIERYQNGKQTFSATVTQEDSFYFAFPEDWLSGEYELCIYAQKEGYLHSYKGENKKFNISRIDNVSEISVERTEDKLDYDLTWSGVANAEGYEFKAGDKTYFVETSSVKVSDLYKNLNFNSSCEISFRTVPAESGGKNANSTYITFYFEIFQNKVSEIKVGENGKLCFTADQNEFGYYIYAQSEGNKQHLSYLIEDDRRSVVITDENKEIVLTGNLQISIITLSSDVDKAQRILDGATIYLDDAPKTANIHKLQNIKSVTKDALTGEIQLSGEHNQEVDVCASAIINGVEQVVNVGRLVDGKFAIRAEELVSMFAGVSAGELTFNIFVCTDSDLRSEAEEVKFEYRLAKTFVNKKSNKYDDYLVLYQDWKNRTTESQDELVNDNISNLNVKVGEEKTNVGIDLAKGYWNEVDGIETFTKEPVNESSKKCYAICVADYLKESGSVSITYVEAPFEVYGASAEYEFTKLKEVENFELRNGNLLWDKGEKSSEGYLLEFNGREKSQQKFIDSSMSTFVAGEDIDFSGDFEITIRNVSSKLGVLSSDRSDIITAHKLAGISSSITLQNGALSMEFNDKREGEKTLESMETVLGKYYETWRAWDIALTENRLGYPYDFAAKDIERDYFNLKFVSRADGVQKEYVTRVRAIDLLTRLSLSAELQESYDSIAREIGSNAHSLKPILESKDYFKGVAISTLLFDEINLLKEGEVISGNEIPAGVYDVYIQQAGTDSLISSTFAKCLSGVELLPAPITRGASEIKDRDLGTKNYYVKFKPRKNDAAYTLSLKLEEQVAEYLITHDGTKWSMINKYPSSDGVSKIIALEKTDSEGFVYIQLNDYLLKDADIKDVNGETISLSGKTFYARIYENGDSTHINGKSETITVTALEFKYKTLAVMDGNFYWENFVGYPSMVVYSLNKNIMKYETYLTSNYWSPSEAGEYDYFKFMTPGSSSEFEVNVESKIYVIKNVKKIKSPKVNVVDGKISISENQEKDTSGNNLIKHVQISAGGYKNTYNVENSGSGYSLLHQTGVNEMSANDEDYPFALAEQNASQFGIIVLGDKVANDQITFGSEENNEIELVIDGYGANRKLLLQSEEIPLPAEKLTSGIESFMALKDGILTWDNMSDKAGENQAIVYELTIDYFREEGGNVWTQSNHTETIYLLDNSFDSAEIVDPLDSIEYRYVISVRAKLMSTVANGGSYVEIGGKRYYSLTNVKYASNNGRYVLDGELLRMGVDDNNEATNISLLSRSRQVVDLKVEDGQITFANGEEGQSFKIYKIDDTSKTLIEGIIDDSTGKNIFIPNKDNKSQLVDNQRYKFTVISYSEGKLKSRFTNLKNGLGSDAEVRMLPVLNDSDYAANRNSQGHIVDFAAYYSRISGYNGITLRIEQDGKAAIVKTQSDSKWVFEDNQVEAEVTAIPTTASYLRPYTSTKISLSVTEWSSDDFIYFDPQSQTYYWTYGVKIDYYAINNPRVYANEAGQPLSMPIGEIYNENIEFGEYLPVYRIEQAELQIRYVLTSQVQISQNNDKPQVSTLAGIEQVQIYSLEGGEYTPIGVLSGSEQLELAQDVWQVKCQTPVDSSAQTYYVSASKIGKNQNGFIAFADAELFKNKELTEHITLQGDMTKIEIIGEQNASEFTQVVLNGKFFYLKSENILKRYSQNEISTETTFKLKVVTESSHNITDGTRKREDVKTTRTYENIALGKLIEGKWDNQETAEGGIYISSFEPNIMGRITTFEVQVRNSKNNLLSSAKSYDKQVEVNLFGSWGEGTKQNPYSITQPQQFENIKFRLSKRDYHNTYIETRVTTTVDLTTSPPSSSTTTKRDVSVTEEEQVFNFSQANDLTFNLNGFKIDGEFSGVYNGNGNAVTINVGSVQSGVDVRSTIASGNNAISDVAFERGAGLFKKITSLGQITGLKVNFKVDYDNLVFNNAGKNTLIGGLALINEGQIDNITVTSSEVNFSSAISSGSAIGISPIVAYNLGTVDGAQATSNVNITSTIDGGNQSLYYSQIALFNGKQDSKAKITNSNNSGEIKISFSSNPNGTIMASGIVISNFANIEKSNNSGNITITAENSSSTYASGIAVLSVGGRITSCTNSGTISAQYKNGTVFQSRNTTING